MERCRCRCHAEATGDVLEARQRGSMYLELIAKNRAENLAACAPDGPELTEEIPAFLACPTCQPQHSVALSSRREIVAREQAPWDARWGYNPAEPPGERNRFD